MEWTTIGAITTTFIGTLGAVFIAHIKTKRQANEIAEHVDNVRKLAEPTGNGFARDTTEKLDLLVEMMRNTMHRQDRTEQIIVDHLSDHTKAQLMPPDTRD